MKNNNNEEDIFIDTEEWLGIDMKAIQKEEEKRAKQQKKLARAKKRREWLNRNLGTILVVTPVAVGAITALAKSATNIVRAANRRSELNIEQKKKDYYCYDRSAGHYWELNRKLSNSDWTHINKRRANGDKLADILADMNVLK